MITTDHKSNSFERYEVYWLLGTSLYHDPLFVSAVSAVIVIYTLSSMRCFYERISMFVFPKIRFFTVRPPRVAVADHEGINGGSPGSREVQSPVGPVDGRQGGLHGVRQQHLPVLPHWHRNLRCSVTG